MTDDEPKTGKAGGSQNCSPLALPNCTPEGARIQPKSTEARCGPGVALAYDAADFRSIVQSLGFSSAVPLVDWCTKLNATGTL